jgi:hypothetical protein
MRSVALFSLLIAAPAVADSLPVTLDRTDRGTRFGAQASFQLYPGFDDTYGVRSELFGQYATPVANGGAAGVYGHMPLAHIFAPSESLTVVGSLELGGLYVARLGPATDLAGHLGLSMPTASDGEKELVANVITGLERNHDLVDAFPGTTLNLGGTLRARPGASVTIQLDVALDAPISEGDGPDRDKFLHLNAGAQWSLGPAAILVEVATTSFAESIGSLALGARFALPGHPHVAYVMAFASDEATPDPDGGIVAHMLSVGVYTGN